MSFVSFFFGTLDTNHNRLFFRSQCRRRLWSDQGWQLVAGDRLEGWCPCIWLHS